MSDAGDEIQVDAPAAEVEVSTDAPKGKLSVEDALQVRLSRIIGSENETFMLNSSTASSEECPRSRRFGSWSP